MKAWELIKALEEGGVLKHRHGSYPNWFFQHFSEPKGRNWENILGAPYDWEIVKPKKKVKYHAYRLRNYDDYTLKLSTSNDLCEKDFIRFPNLDQEIEVDDES